MSICSCIVRLEVGSNWEIGPRTLGELILMANIDILVLIDCQVTKDGCEPPYYQWLVCSLYAP